jgi:hypothetical protein
MSEESKKMSEKSRKGDKEKMEWGIENGRDRERERERERETNAGLNLRNVK